MTAEYRTEKAVVRVHGTANHEIIKAATVRLMKRAREARKKKGKNNDTIHS